MGQNNNDFLQKWSKNTSNWAGTQKFLGIAIFNMSSVIILFCRAMSVGNEDDISFFQGDMILCYFKLITTTLKMDKCWKSIIYTCWTVPELRGDYNFGEGGRPRMGKRESTMGKRETTMGKREYTFADGSRPRMGKRDPVEETDSLDRGKKHYC